jgi:hypothetical protein
MNRSLAEDRGKEGRAHGKRRIPLLSGMSIADDARVARY